MANVESVGLSCIEITWRGFVIWPQGLFPAVWIIGQISVKIFLFNWIYCIPSKDFNDRTLIVTGVNMTLLMEYLVIFMMERRYEGSFHIKLIES